MIWEEYIDIQHLQYSYEKLIEEANKITGKLGSTIKNNQEIKYFTQQST